MNPRASLLLCTLAACSAGDTTDIARAAAPLEPTVRDSAGVTIYEHPADALERAPRWVVDSVPLITVGGEGEGEDLTRVFSLHLLSDGRLAGFDGDRGGVRVFSAQGIPERIIGRSGEGPGEFRRANGISWSPGDTLLVTDEATSRFTITHPDTGVLEMRQREMRINGNGFTIAGRLRDGSWLFKPAGWIIVGAGAPEAGEAPAPVAFGSLALREDDESLDSIGVLTRPVTRTYKIRFRGRDTEGAAPALFGAFGDVVAWDGLAASLRTDAWQVELRAPDGTLEGIVRKVGPLRPSEPWMLDSLAAERSRAAAVRSDGMESAEDAEYNARNRPMESEVPPFGAAWVSPGGTLWLADATVPGEPLVGVTALDRQGRILGRVFLPASEVRRITFGDDRVVRPSVDDATGLVTFSVHRLVTP